MAIPSADFALIKRIFLGVGTVALFASCVMTFKFGYSFSAIHGLGLLMVTIAAAFIFPAKRFIEEAGVGRMGRFGLGVIGCFLIALELFGDLGYTIGQRDKQLVESGAQTVAYNAVQDNMISEKANLTMWREQLASLKAQNAWAASTTATGLRAQLAASDKAIELETKRGGCKAKCLKLMEDKGKLEARIATLETTEDLSKRIEATQRILDRKVDKAPETKIGHSTVKAQVDFVSKGYLLLTGDSAEKALNPDQVTMTVADWVIGFAIALGATFLPTVSYYIAFFSPKPRTAPAPAHTVEPEPVNETIEQIRRFAGRAGRSVVNITAPVMDDRLRGDLRKALA